MKVTHQGYSIEQITGGLTATIVDTQSCVEITLFKEAGIPMSYDLEGLEDLVGDLNTLIALARNVDIRNEHLRREEG